MKCTTCSVGAPQGGTGGAQNCCLLTDLVHGISTPARPGAMLVVLLTLVVVLVVPLRISYFHLYKTTLVYCHKRGNNDS